MVKFPEHELDLKNGSETKNTVEMIKKETVHEENSLRLAMVKFPQHEQT
jgi:hypothetical protein